MACKLGVLDAFRFQAAFYDNRADRRLVRGQYAWQTRFAQAGLEAKLGPDLTFLAEGALGDTGMGRPCPAARRCRSASAPATRFSRGPGEGGG